MGRLRLPAVRPQATLSVPLGDRSKEPLNGSESLGRPKSFSIVCLSSQEWDVPLPTNRQQVMRRAGRRGHDVVFAETGGWLGRHLWRLVRGPGRRSLVLRLTVGQRVAERVRVVKLLAFAPFAQRSALAGALNWRLGGFAVRRAARRTQRPRVAWVYDPLASAAVGTLGEAFAVYDCVDDYAEQVGPDPRSRSRVAAADRRAAARARVVFTTTRPLYERHRQLNPNTHLVRNAGDFEHFRPAVERSTAEPELLALGRPVLGFVGSLDPLKVDFAVLDAVADAFPDGTVVVVGPAHPDGEHELAQLVARANVRWLGAREYPRLPGVVAAFDVALIPYAVNDYTRSVFPLKLFEYLSAGKPVVATGLPEVAELEPHVAVREDARGAVAAVAAALDDDGLREEWIALASRNTWDVRTDTLLSFVGEELRKEERRAAADRD
jgi:glycosyltransferase involved in cell wall biosynthesis